MSLFDLRRYWSYRLGLFGSRFPSSIASFRPLIHPISSSGSEVMEFWLWSYHFFCLRATSQDPFHHVLSSFDAIDHLIISFQRAKDRPDRSTRSSDKAPSLYPSSSYSPPERSHHIPVILLSFFTVQHSIYIYFSTPFCSPHPFSTASLFSQSAPSWSVLQSSDIIWTYLSQIFVIFLYQGVILGCFSLVYHLVIISWPFPVHFLCYPTHSCYHQPQFAILSSSSTTTTTFHFHSLGIRGMVLFVAFRCHQVEGSPVFSLSVTLSAELSKMFGTFGVVR